jgi:hypothetical protein
MHDPQCLNILYTNNANADWQWNLAKALVDKYDLIAYENLAASNIMKNHSLAKAIQDASGFWVDWKAKQNGTLAVAVDPEYSTQECHAKVALSERTFVCPSCGYAAEGFQGWSNHTSACYGQNLRLWRHLRLGNRLVNRVRLLLVVESSSRVAYEPKRWIAMLLCERISQPRFPDQQHRYKGKTV